MLGQSRINRRQAVSRLGAYAVAASVGSGTLMTLSACSGQANLSGSEKKALEKLLTDTNNDLDMLNILLNKRAGINTDTSTSLIKDAHTIRSAHQNFLRSLTHQHDSSSPTKASSMTSNAAKNTTNSTHITSHTLAEQLFISSDNARVLCFENTGTISGLAASLSVSCWNIAHNITQNR